MYKILLVDDEEEILNDRSHIITGLGYKCYTARNGDEAAKMVQQIYPDVVLTDMKMPNQDGFYVLKTTNEIDANIPVILFTGYASVESAVQAMKMGAHDYIQKPVSPEIMEAVLAKAIDYRILKEENITLKKQIENSYHLDDVVCKSKLMMNVVKRVLKVAKSEANVLLLGESGTGKELIARSIHFQSHRKNGPFIPLDCVALPATLLESELFGFEEGAFTGAVKSKPGVLELADGGTLFLDEIAELDRNLQAKLLRVLQERQFRRIGGLELIDVNVRIISATNKDIKKAIEEKVLRQDLYFRLNVVPIHLPPLRERKEDIPLLVHHSVKKFNPSCTRDIKEFSKDAITCLKRYDWPGNVRELQNVIEQSMSMAEHDIIELKDLPDNILENNALFIEKPFQSLTFKQAKEKFLNQFYERYFNNLIKKHSGNISKAAREADVSRRTIYRILKKY